MSWIPWLIAWVLILFNLRYKIDTPWFTGLILAFDNFSSLFLILTFLVLTRGDTFGIREILVAAVRLGAALVMASILLYSLSPWLGLDLVLQVHQTWGLCIGIVAPILVGWAVTLRFNVWLVLAIGFVYGLMKPVGYEAELFPQLFQQVQRYRPAIAVTIAGLKVAWALAFMRVMVSYGAERHSLVPTQPTPRSKPKQWDWTLKGQALLLGSVFLVLVVVMLLRNGDQTGPLANALTIVCGFIAIIDIVWKLLDRSGRPQPPEAPPAEAQPVEAPQPEARSAGTWS